MGAWNFMGAPARKAAVAEGEQIGASVEILADAYGAPVDQIVAVARKHGFKLIGVPADETDEHRRGGNSDASPAAVAEVPAGSSSEASDTSEAGAVQSRSEDTAPPISQAEAIDDEAAGSVRAAADAQQPMEESHEIAPALALAAVSVLPIPPEPETAVGEPIAISLSDEALDILSAFAHDLDVKPADLSAELLTAILLDDAEAHGRPRTGPALLILTVDVATRDALIAAADRRRREVADLAGEILSVAVNDHMVDAILDDGEAA